MRRWVGDLVLGFRLAVGGGRGSWTRLALTGIGIGVGVAVLLVATSLPTALAARDVRAEKLRGETSAPIPGVDPLYKADLYTDFGDRSVRGSYLKAGGPAAPLPPGADRIPGDGEILVSPELKKLLASPEGELLRPRFPERIVGTIGQPGLEGPYELRFYAGDAGIEPAEGNTVYEFGGGSRAQVMNPFLYLTALFFVVILLFPVLVFVGISTRLSGAQRDRRLAALRLIGASAHRVRRIAAGEALLGALIGLTVGFALFYFVRQFTEQIRLASAAVFRSDLTPAVPLMVLVVLFVPVLAVVTSMIAMRRTVIEPLGVVRDVKPVRRSLWWRLVPILLGIGLLAGHAGAVREVKTTSAQVALVTGVCLLMLGIPLLLPWLVERSVGMLTGGSPAWQLAVRRLQLDSGTAARVVGGVAVVLAGAIALQTILATAERDIIQRDDTRTDINQLIVNGAGPGIGEALAQSPAVREVYGLGYLSARTEQTNDWLSVIVADCRALNMVLKVPDCRDGSVYLPEGSDVRSGETLAFVDEEGNRGTRWTVPDAEHPAINPIGPVSLGVYVTPSVLRSVVTQTRRDTFHAMLDPAVPNAAEQARNALAPLRWRANAYFAGKTGMGEAEQVFTAMRRGLFAGAVLVLLLVGASLLVVAVEQIRERRRPLAVLAASGVPRRVLAWSLLWQNAFPLVLAMVVSVATGAGLGALLLKVLAQPVTLDWAGIALLTGVTSVAVLLVTLLTLPALRRATGALGLRAE